MYEFSFARSNLHPPTCQGPVCRARRLSKVPEYGGFPEIRGTLLGVPIIRTIVFWGLYWVPFFWETTIWRIAVKALRTPTWRTRLVITQVFSYKPLTAVAVLRGLGGGRLMCRVE